MFYLRTPGIRYHTPFQLYMREYASMQSKRQKQIFFCFNEISNSRVSLPDRDTPIPRG